MGSQPTIPMLKPYKFSGLDSMSHNYNTASCCIKYDLVLSEYAR